jgi:D-arabinono-1,4-lactone oxidase
MGIILLCCISLILHNQYLHHTTEWAIPYQNSKACLREIRAWLEQESADPKGIRPHVPMEIRFSAADDIWLSPSNGRETCWLGIIQFKSVLSSCPTLSNLTLLQGHTDSMYPIASTSRVVNEFCRGIRAAPIGRRHTLYSQTTYGYYTLGSTIFFVCYNSTILMVCFAMNTFSDILWEGLLAEGFSSYEHSLFLNMSIDAYPNLPILTYTNPRIYLVFTVFFVYTYGL